jgi:DNA primase
LDDRTRTRRDHDKYLTLIDTLALLHQHQRAIKTVPIQTSEGIKTIEYVEASVEDVKQANAIAHAILGISLDELAPQTRRLLGLIVAYVQGQVQGQHCRQNEVRFTRKQLREATGWGDTQLKVHLARLAELEHLIAHREGLGYRYELVFDGPVLNGVHLSGLIDVARLEEKTAGEKTANANSIDEKTASKKPAYDAARSGSLEGWSGAGRALVGGQSVLGRSDLNSASLGELGLTATLPKPAPENASNNHAQEPTVPYLNAPGLGSVLPVAVSSLAAGVGVSLAA